MHEECRYKSQVNESQPALLTTEKAEEDLWISSKQPEKIIQKPQVD